MYNQSSLAYFIYFHVFYVELYLKGEKLMETGHWRISKETHNSGLRKICVQEKYDELFRPQGGMEQRWTHSLGVQTCPSVSGMATCIPQGPTLVPFLHEGHILP